MLECALCLLQYRPHEVVRCTGSHATCQSCVIRIIMASKKKLTVAQPTSPTVTPLHCTVKGCSDQRPYSLEALGTVLMGNPENRRRTRKVDKNDDDDDDDTMSLSLAKQQELQTCRATLIRLYPFTAIVPPGKANRRRSLQGIIANAQRRSPACSVVTLPWFSPDVELDCRMFTPFNRITQLWDQHATEEEEAESAVFEIIFYVLVGRCGNCHVHFDDTVSDKRRTIICNACGSLFCRKCLTSTDLLGDSIDDHQSGPICKSVQEDLTEKQQIQVSAIVSKLSLIGYEIALGIMMYFVSPWIKFKSRLALSDVAAGESTSTPLCEHQISNHESLASVPLDADLGIDATLKQTYASIFGFTDEELSRFHEVLQSDDATTPVDQTMTVDEAVDSLQNLVGGVAGWYVLRPNMAPRQALGPVILTMAVPGEKIEHIPILVCAALTQHAGQYVLTSPSSHLIYFNGLNEV